MSPIPTSTAVVVLSASSEMTKKESKDGRSSRSDWRSRSRRDFPSSIRSSTASTRLPHVDLVNQFGDYRLASGLFIYDRGIVSKRNVKDIKTYIGTPCAECLCFAIICGIPSLPRTAL